MTNAHRDLSAAEPWARSLERSRRRRALLPKARRENRRKKHVSAALATAVVAGPATPLAAAQVTSGDLSAAVAAESPANRAIEIREGGLPLQAGSQGDLVVQVQRALHVDADGIFGVQTDAAVRSYQQAKGLDVDGIVGLATWGSLFPGQAHAASAGAAIGGSNIPAAAQSTVEQTVSRRAASWPPRAMPGSPARSGGTTGVDTTGRPAPPGPARLRADHARLGAGSRYDDRERLWLEHDHPARERSGDVPVRAARRPEPRRDGHRGRDRHARARGRVRNGEPGRPAERLRKHRVHHAHEPVLDVLRPPVALRHLDGCARAAGPGDRLRGVHRQLHRPAPPLRDPSGRRGAQPDPVPGRRIDAGSLGERDQGEREQLEPDAVRHRRGHVLDERADERHHADPVRTAHRHRTGGAAGDTAEQEDALSASEIAAEVAPPGTEQRARAGGRAPRRRSRPRPRHRPPRPTGRSRPAPRSAPSVTAPSPEPPERTRP